MSYIDRKIGDLVNRALAREKSILLLGPRQTGKTTFLDHQVKPDLTFSFAHIATRLHYEKNPVAFAQELKLETEKYDRKPLVLIDEVQKIPLIMDVAQDFIDKKMAQFILTGSSARKLKHGAHVNLLPGRVVSLVMDPLTLEEIPTHIKLDDLLLYGSLPNIITEADEDNKENDLYSYVSTYLEEEVRAEALVRNIGHFARFLELAAGESGLIVNFTKLSQEIGIAASTIADYYQVLEDCLIIQRIDPITDGITHRRLIKSPKYLFFDLGVRRACANEGVRLSSRTLAHLFEQYIGLELMRYARLKSPKIKLKYWRDSAGPEIDFVIDVTHHYIPIEVKWSAHPNLSDAGHLVKFMQEYKVDTAYIVCNAPKAYKISPHITALPWQELAVLFG